MLALMLSGALLSTSVAYAQDGLGEDSYTEQGEAGPPGSEEDPGGESISEEENDSFNDEGNAGGEEAGSKDEENGSGESAPETSSDNKTETGSGTSSDNKTEAGSGTSSDNKTETGSETSSDNKTETSSGTSSDNGTEAGSKNDSEKSDAVEAVGKTENVSGSEGSGIYETSQSKVPETEEKQQPENEQTEENQSNDEKKTHEALKDSDNEEKTHENLDNSNNEEKNHDIQQPEAVTSAPLTETTDAKMPQEELLTKTAQTPETALLSAAAPQTATALTSNTISSTEKVISIIGDSVQISVNGNNQLEIIKGADKTTYTNTTELKKVTINAKNDISFKNPEGTAPGGGWLLDLANAVVELIAKQISLQPNSQVTLKVKELNIHAQDSDGTDSGDVFLNVVKKVYDSDTTYVGLKNMNIVAAGPGAITISATNDKTLAASGNESTADGTNQVTADGVWKKIDGKIEDVGSYLVNVKNVETIIEIEDCDITAGTITLNSTNKLTMNTKSVGVGVAVNVANASSAVLVKNSNLKSTTGDITMTAKSIIESNVDADAKVGNIAVGVSVVGGTTEVVIDSNEGNNIISAGSLILNADSNAKANTNATGKKTNSSQSGAFAGVAVVNYNTRANIGGNVNVTAAKDVKVNSTQYGVNGTTASAVKADSEGDSSSVKQTALNTILGVVDQSLDNIELTSKIKDKASQTAAAAKTKISSWFKKDEVEGKVSEALNTAGAEDDSGDMGIGSLFEGAESQSAENVKLTFKDRNGKEVKGVTVKITPNEGTTGVSRLQTLKGNVYDGSQFAAGSYTVTIIVPSGYSVPEDQIIEILQGKGYTGTITLAKTNNSKNQLVGALAVMVVNSDNEASITTTGKIQAGGTVEVVANAVSNNTTTADASTIPSGLEKDPEDDQVLVAAVTEDGSTTLPLTITLKKKGDTSNPYSQTFNDKDGLITFGNGITSSGTNQKLTAGTYELTFKLPTSFGFTPKDMSGLTATKKKIGGIYYNVYTMNITLKAKSGAANSVEGLKQLITMTAAKPAGAASGETGTTVSAGVGIGVGVINSSNLAYIENATVEAGGLNVSAKTGGQELTVTTTEDGKAKEVKKTYDNASDVSSASGFNSGKFGIGGAISVNVVNDVTRAYINNATIIIGRNGNITISAESKSDGNTKAGSDDSLVEWAKSTGVGSAIAVSVVNHETSAELGSSASVSGKDNASIGNVAITADAAGTVEVASIAGAAGGKAVVPVVSVNVLNTVTKAKAAAHNDVSKNMIALTGDMILRAKSSKKRKTVANGKAAGASVAAGGAVSVAAGSMNQYAYMERNLTGANNITVTAESTNSSETTSVAGANGAAAPEEDDSTGSGEDDGESHSKTSPDDLVNKALASGKRAGGGTGNITGTDSKTPQTAETTEGKVTVAAAVSVDIWKDHTVAAVNANTTSTGKLTVDAKAKNDVAVTANASAVLGTNGVGVSVAILAGELTNKAIITGTHTTGTFSIKAGMADENGKEGTNNITVISISGAGASNVGVAGAVAINIFDTDYLAGIGADGANAKLTASGTGVSDVTAKVNQNVVTKSGASADLAGDSNNSNKSVGIGASFGLTIADAKAQALVKKNSTVNTAGGSFKAESVINSKVETYVEAGNDAYEEPAEDGKITITVKDSDGKALENAKIKITVNGNSETMTTDESGHVEISVGTISADTKYMVEIISVPKGYKMPSNGNNKVTFTLTEDNTAFAKTFVLTKNGQEDSDKYASMDAAVSVSLVSNKAKAEIEQGAGVETGKDLTINAESASATTATATGKAEAKNAAAGASAAVNLVAEEVTARLAGNVALGTDLTVTAKALAQDLAKAYATASGLDLQRYKDKYNSTIADILSGKAFGTGNSSSGKNTGTTSGAASSGSISETGKANSRLDEKLSETAKNNGGNETSNDTSLSSKVLVAAGAKTNETTTVDTGSVGTTGSGSANSANAKNEAGTVGNTEKKENPVSVAAAVGVSIVSHDVTAQVTGTVTKAKNVTIKAENLDNFETLATGAAVSKKTSIALGTAIVVNNSKTLASLTGNLGDVNNKVGDVTVKADTKHNMSGDYITKLGAEAIAGAGNGSEEGGAAVAGAVAVITSNAATTAEIGNGTVIYSDGNVKVEATEQSKLAARAWGATLTSAKFDEQNKSGGQTSGSSARKSGAGVGAAFSVIYANNKTKACVGDGAQIYASSLTVNAEKQAVNASFKDGIGNIEINGVISTGSGHKGTVTINTTDKAQSNEEITLKDLAGVTKDLWDLLANKNYYLEAASGAASTVGSKFTGAGSFTVLVMNDSAEALVGKNVVLVLTNGLTITASSKVNAVTVTGSVAYGGNKSAGVGINTVVNNTVVNAGLGDSANVGAGGDVTVSADSDMDLVSILVAAAVSSARGGANGKQFAGDGVVNVFVNNNKTTAAIGQNVTINATGDIKVTSASKLGYTGIVGGLAAGGGHGVGASVSVVVINAKTLSEIGKGANITARNLTVSADAKETIVAVIVNGAAATGTNGVAVAVSPAVNVIKSETIAKVGTGNYTLTGAMNVTAKDATKIVIASGGAAGSTSKVGAGGSVQVDVFLKTVKALIGDGTGASDCAVILAPGGLTVSADSKEDMYLFIIGLGGGKSAGVSGSVGVAVVENDVEAIIGKYTRAGSTDSRGDVIVSARDDMELVVAAGGFAASVSGPAVGLSNADVIVSGKTQAFIGDHAVIYGRNLVITADSNKNFINIVVSGGVTAGSVAATGSVAVVVVGDTVKAAAGENAVLNAAGDVKVTAKGSTDITDIVGTVGFSKGVAAGASIDTVVYSGTVYAGIGKGTTVISAGDVIVSAKSDDRLVDLVVGIDGSNGSAAVNGSVAVIVAKQNVFALIGTPDGGNNYADATGTIIKANGSIGVTAEAEQLILSGAGSAALTTGNVGMGAGIIVITDSHRAWAQAGRNAVLDALGQGNGITGNFGKLEVTDSTSGNITYKSGKHGQMTINGILIGAFGTTNIHALAVSAGAGSTVGAGASSVTTVEAARTQAIINEGARINRESGRNGGQAAVYVVASGDSVESVSGGSAGISGSTGISGCVVVYTGKKYTEASIRSGANVFAEKEIVVLAHTDNQLYATAVGVAGSGSTAAGATVSVIYLKDETTASAGGTLEGASITVQAEADERLVMSVMSAAVSGSTAAGASVGTIVFKGITRAIVLPGVQLTAANGGIKVSAQSNEKVNLTVAGAAGSGSASVAGSFAVLIMNVTTQSMVQDSNAAAKGSLTAAGSVEISAADKTEFDLIVGGASFGGSAAVGAAIGTTIYRNSVTAMIGNNNIVVGKNIRVTAAADRNIRSSAVMAGVGGSASVNGSILIISVGAATTDQDADKANSNGGSNSSTNVSSDAAKMGQSAVDACYGQKIGAGSSNQYVDEVNNELAGLKYETSGLVSGYFNPVNVSDKTYAGIGNGGSTTAKNGDILVEASEKTTIHAAAGTANVSGSASVGISMIVAIVNGTAQADLGGTVEAVNGNIQVHGINELNIEKFMAVGGGASGSVSVAGTITVLKVGERAIARIANGANVTAAGSVVVLAESVQDILVINGNVTASGTVSAGVATNVIIFANETNSYINENAKVTAKGLLAGVDFIDGNITSSVDSGYKNLNGSSSQNSDHVNSTSNVTKQTGVLVGARSSQKIRSWVISGAASGTVAATGSVNVLTFNSKTSAWIGMGANITTGNKGDILVIAVDTTSIQDVTGNVSASGAVSAGAGSDTITFRKLTNAYVADGAVLNSAGNIIVKAASDETYVVVVASAGVSSVAAINGAASVIVIENKTIAEIKSATLNADGSIAVWAEDDQNLFAAAGAASAAVNPTGSLSAAAGVVVVRASNQVKALVGSGAQLNALGNKEISFYTGQLSGNNGQKNRSRIRAMQRGILIGAFNNTHLNAVAASGSVSVGGAASAATVTVISNAQIIAKVESGAKLNQGSREGEDKSSGVKVIAMDSTEEEVEAGGAAASIVGGAGTVVVLHLTKTAEAILNGTVYAPGEIKVLAVSDNNAFLASASLGAGLAGGAGSVSVLNIENTVHSALGGVINAAGAVLAEALNRQYITTGALAAAGGSVAAGGAVATILFKSQTTAKVLDGAQITAASLAVNAQSEETITGTVAAAAAGSGAASGSLVLIIADSKTKALTGNNVTIILSGDLNVVASDTATITMTAGTVSGGGVSAGGAAAVLIFKNTVLAEIGQNNRIKAVNLNLKAGSIRNITSYILAGSAGGAAVSGGVFVILVGSEADSDSKTALGSMAKTTQENIDEALKGANSMARSKAAVSVTGYFTSDAANATTARIGSNTKITLTGNAVILASEKTNLKAVVGAAAGGAFAAGGSVAIAILKGTSQAEILGTITADGTVTITAENSITGTEFSAKAGSAGVVGLGAAIAYMDVTGTTQILIRNTADISGKGGVAGNASLVVNVNPTADGFAGGWVAAGLAAARLKVAGKTLIQADRGSRLASANGDVALTAYQTLTTNASSMAAGGGYAAAEASVALVDVSSETTVDSAANVEAAKGNYSILAKQVLNSQAVAKGIGVSFAGSIGAAVARLKVKPIICAAVTGGTINAANLNVRALFNAEDNGNDSTGYMRADAYAGAAGTLVGGSGAFADVILDGKTTAEVKNAGVTLTGDALVHGKADTGVSASGQGLSIGSLAVGGVVVNLSNTFKVLAQIVGSTVKAQNVSVFADYIGSLKGTAKGVAGGLLAAGTAQSLNLTENVTTDAALTNSIVNASANVSVIAQDTHNISGTATGFSGAAFASGGLTKIDTKLTNTTKAQIIASTVTAADILLHAVTGITKNTKATASSGALGGSANDVSDNTTVTNKTYAVAGTGSNLTAADTVTISAVTDNHYKGYATAIAGAIVAKGVATAYEKITDDVRVQIYPSVIKAGKGDVDIYAYAKDITENLTAYGGAGGLAAGTNVKAEAVTDAAARVEFINGTAADHAVISAVSADLFIEAKTNTEANVYARIKFTVDGLSNIATLATNKMTINALVDLGSYTQLTAGKDLLIQAWIERIHAFAEAYSETGSVINTQSKPTAEVNVVGTAKITGTNPKLRAGNQLTMLALTGDGSKESIYTRAYSYGYTAGGTGSVISTATNNTKLYGYIQIYGDSSELRAKDIWVKASAKSESETSYSKEAQYKAVTVTEFVKQTVEHVTTKVEKVVDKICKKLPWPLNKIVKWITKTVVKVVRWFEEVIVEKVLQSETDKRENGSYTGENQVELNGNIYYGSNAPVTVVVEEDGTVKNANVTWTGNGNTITIDSINTKALGSLQIESTNGKVLGNVTVHSNNLITELNIINNSAKNLILKNLDLLAEYDPDNCAYNIICSDYSQFNMTDVVDAENSVQPVVTITTNSGKDVTFDGLFSYYTAILNVLFNGAAGNVYLGENGQLDVAELYIKNALNVGADGSPLKVNLFVTGDDENNLKTPKLTVDAAGNVYIDGTLVRYAEVEGKDVTGAKKLADAKAAQITSVSKGIFDSVKGKNIKLTLNRPQLIVGVLVKDILDSTYTYEKTTAVETALDVVVKSERSEADAGALYEKEVFNEDTGRWETRYYTDAQCTAEYTVPSGKHIEERYNTEGFGYYLVTKNEDGSKRYEKLDTGAVYRTDEDGNRTGEVEVTIHGETRIITLDAGDAISYLKKEDGSTYTDKVPKSYWLVDDVYNTWYEPASAGTSDFDSIRYNPDNGKYEALKDGKVAASYEYIAMVYDEKTNTYSYKGITRKTETITEKLEGGVENLNTLRYSYDIDGTYNLGTITAQDDLKISADGTNVNLTGIAFAGNTLNLRADNVRREGNQDADLKADIITVQVKDSFGTAGTPVRVETGAGGFNTTPSSVGDIYLAVETAKELTIGNIISNGNVQIKAAGAIKALETAESNIRAAALKILSSTAVGGKDNSLKTDISGNMSILSSGNVYVNEKSAANVENITSTGSDSIVSITAERIANRAAGGNAAITAANIILNAGNGNIGSTNNNLSVNLGNGTLDAESDLGSIYLNNLSNDMKLGQVKAKDKVVLKTAGDITGSAGQTAVISDSAELTSIAGSIGTAENILKTDLNSLKAEAADSLYLDNTVNSGSLELEKVKAGNTAQISANGITGTAAEGENDITAGKIDLNAGTGNIGTDERALRVSGPLENAQAGEMIHVSSAKDLEAGILKADKVKAESTGNMTIGTVEAAETELVSGADLEAAEIKSDKVKAESTGTMTIADLLADRAELKAGTDMDITTSESLRSGTLEAENIRLTTAKDAGSAEEALELTADAVTIKAGGLVNIHENSTEDGTTTIEAEGGEDVTVKIERDTKIASAAGSNVTVNAGGSLNAGNMTTGGTGLLDIIAKDDIVIDNPEGNFKNLVSENGSIDLTVAGNIEIEHLAAADLVNMTAQDSIKAKAEGILKVGSLSAAKIIDIIADSDIVNGRTDGGVNVKAEEVKLTTDGNIGEKDNFFVTEAEKAAMKSENLYLKNEGSLILDNTEAAKDADLDVNGDVTTADGAVLEADNLHITAENADLTTNVKDLSGNVTGSISVTDKGSIAVTGTLTAGEDVSIQAAENGNITVSGIIHAANTFLRGAAKIIVTVKDTMGNLGVETSDREDSSADIKLESCDRSQDLNITTPGEVRLTTTEADEIIDFFADRIQVTGGANNAVLNFTKAPAGLKVRVPGGNNLINVTTTVAPTDIQTGNGDDTFILGGPVEDEKDSEYTYKYKDENGFMGAGNLHRLDIATEGGSNTWHLWMSGEKFYLTGGMGNDTFIRYTFEVTDKEGQTYTFATRDYNISSLSGNITCIGFPTYRGTSSNAIKTARKWIQMTDGSWKYRTLQGYVESRWLKLGRNWWYFNEDGRMHTGWFLYGNRWYYLIPGEGSMAAGWNLINGFWYYLNLAGQAERPEGAMYSNEYTLDGYFVGTDGRWMPEVPKKTA